MDLCNVFCLLWIRNLCLWNIFVCVFLSLFFNLLLFWNLLSRWVCLCGCDSSFCIGFDLIVWWKKCSSFLYFLGDVCLILVVVLFNFDEKMFWSEFIIVFLLGRLWFSYLISLKSWWILVLNLSFVDVFDCKRFISLIWFFFFSEEGLMIEVMVKLVCFFVLCVFVDLVDFVVILLFIGWLGEFEFLGFVLVVFLGGFFIGLVVEFFFWY